MFISNFFRNPNQHSRLFSTCISKQLSQVIVIGGSKLIFDDNVATRTRFSGEYIQKKTTYIHLPTYQLHIHTQNTRKLIKVLT
jgi:hypothetical protein